LTNIAIKEIGRLFDTSEHE